jgi:hypothetical protein
MSSANRVRLAAIAEATYGVTPGAGDFTELRMTSEDLTGTPQTVESAGLRADRQSSGQVNTGLEISGGWDFEASYDASIRQFIEQAMMNDVVAATNEGPSTFDISGGGVNIDRTVGDFTTNISPGDVVVLSGYANAVNNQPVLVTGVTALQLTVVGEGLVDEVGTGDEDVTRPAYYTIGTIEKSMSISKEFLDVADGNVRNIAYTGMRVGEMTMAFAFGSIVTGRFSLAGNGYSTPTVPITNARTVNAAGSDNPLDASNGFGWLLVDDQDIDICLENFEFTLNNNLQAQNCIGELAPKDQILGSAAVSFSATMFLGLVSWDTFMANKLSQTPLSLAFYTRDDLNQGYAITMDRIQVNFPDPAGSGRDAQVSLDVTGTASYDAAAAQTMRIYLLT